MYNKKKDKDGKITLTCPGGITTDNCKFVSDYHEKLHYETGKSIYTKRMSAIERVFGDTKHNKNFTGFLRREMEN